MTSLALLDTSTLCENKTVATRQNARLPVLHKFSNTAVSLFQVCLLEALTHMHSEHHLVLISKLSLDVLTSPIWRLRLVELTIFIQKAEGAVLLLTHSTTF